MDLQPNETVLTGAWVIRDGRAERDAVCERIEWLVANRLKKIADSTQWGAWVTLFRDPADGRYWERNYPKGEMQGGGPPQLRSVTVDEAKQAFGGLPVNC